MELRKENVVTVAWGEGILTLELCYYSTLPYKRALFPKTPSTKALSARQEHFFKNITRLSSFCHGASHNASILHATLWKWKPQDISSWPTTQWSWVTQGSWSLLTSSEYWVGDLTSHESLLHFEISLHASPSPGTEIPCPELSLSDSGASPKATRTKFLHHLQNIPLYLKAVWDLCSF